LSTDFTQAPHSPVAHDLLNATALDQVFTDIEFYGP
jgi:hypothetical protein